MLRFNKKKNKLNISLEVNNQSKKFYLSSHTYQQGIFLKKG